GSTEVGRKLIEQSAEQVLRVSMELGGNAPFLVFADADMDAAVEGAVTAKMRNVGEACTAANRFHVHEAVADEFPQRMTERPVAPIATFSSDDEALQAANRTQYGLVAYVYTRDLARAFRVCERLETGMVGLNQGMVSNPAAPFGGVKQSGFGREGGFEGIGEYLETKYVALSL